MKSCPCGLPKAYLDCCGKYIQQQDIPPTPEALMRSRYTAYTLADTEYIKSTMQGKPLVDFNEQKAAKWAKAVTWLGLKVVHTKQAEDQIGYVEFIASYLDKQLLKTIHEESEFHTINGRWFYIDGKQTMVPTKVVSRNGVCPCGSRKKFKNCHGA